MFTTLFVTAHVHGAFIVVVRPFDKLTDHHDKWGSVTLSVSKGATNKR
ncbi:MAG: hypothetical protein IEMM0002_1566 [bacterium]|nr:MAG: hypothetical protein IEMM0002_1566 [bacterium]